jgi:hypothetical protein
MWTPIKFLVCWDYDDVKGRNWLLNFCLHSYLGSKVGFVHPNE